MKCKNCGRSILLFAGGWFHFASRAQHCSDGLSLAEPKENTNG